jgi:hypothetical protein
MFEKYFVTCPVAVALREAGFDEPCMASWECYETTTLHQKAIVSYKELHIAYLSQPPDQSIYSDKIQKLMAKSPGLFKDQRTNSTFPEWLYAAPLYDQVLEWFMSKGLYLHQYRIPQF